MYYFGKRKLTESLFRELVSGVDAVGIDIESVSLKDTTMTGIGIAPTIEDAFYFVPGEWRHVVEVLNNDRITKVFHNAIFDLEELWYFGIPDIRIADTAFMARLLGLSGSLFELSWDIADSGIGPKVLSRSMSGLLGEYSAKTTKRIPEGILAKKCADDCKATLNAYISLYPLLDNAALEAYMVDVRMVAILLKLSKRGIALDQKKVQELVDSYENKIAYRVGVCQALGLENPASPKQVAKALSNRGILFPKLARGGKYKVETGDKELKFKEDMLAQAVLKFRKDNYFLTHYARPLLNKSRQFSHYHLDASTSRMSSYDMNFMNIPKGDARNCFIPDSGWFTCADGSQLQLRALAYLSQDPVMLRIYDNNGDIHQETADYFSMKRNTMIKSVNFGMIFGASPETIMDTANVNDRSLAEQLIDGWSKKYKVAWEWIQSQQEVGLRDGHVFTDFGRKLYVPLTFGKAHARRCAVNFPIQGIEAEVIKRWLIACDDTGKYDLANIVHDEAVYDGYYEDLPEMNEFSPFQLPMNVKHTKKWE